MSWKCPVCQRSFNSHHQSHSCEIRTLEQHLSGKKPSVAALCVQIIEFLHSLDNVNIQPVKNAIIISAKSSFMALKLRRDYLETELVLNEIIDLFPVYKVVNYTKRKYAHFIKMDSPEDFDSTIKELIIKSYRTNIYG